MKKHQFTGIVVGIEYVDRGRDRTPRYRIVYETEHYPDVPLAIYSSMDIVVPGEVEK